MDPNSETENYSPETLYLELSNKDRHPEVNNKTGDALDLALRHNTFGCALFKAGKIQQSIIHFSKAFTILSING